MSQSPAITSSPHISVVSPVYGAEGMVQTLVDRLKAALDSLGASWEIVLVEDGSPDQSWAEMRQAAASTAGVKAIRLSRNFGQHQAITAGLDHCRGEWIVVMDCDLQDRPEEIPALYGKASSSDQIDYVLARRLQRTDNWFKKMLSRSFYWTLAKLSGTEQDHTVANFGVYHRSVIDAVLSMRESVRYFPLQVRWAGFRAGSLDVQHGDREAGETSYTFRRALNLAIDVMLSFSDKPLRLTIRGGLYISAIGLLLALWLMIRSFIAGTVTGQGWLSLMASLWLLSGIILVVMGMMGLYVGKIFDEVKNRPIYLVAEIVEQQS